MPPHARISTSITPPARNSAAAQIPTPSPRPPLAANRLICLLYTYPFEEARQLSHKRGTPRSRTMPPRSGSPKTSRALPTHLSPRTPRPCTWHDASSELVLPPSCSSTISPSYNSPSNKADTSTTDRERAQDLRDLIITCKPQPGRDWYPQTTVPNPSSPRSTLDRSSTPPTILHDRNPSYRPTNDRGAARAQPHNNNV